MTMMKIMFKNLDKMMMIVVMLINTLKGEFTPPAKHPRSGNPNGDDSDNDENAVQNDSGDVNEHN